MQESTAICLGSRVIYRGEDSEELPYLHKGDLGIVVEYYALPGPKIWLVWNRRSKRCNLIKEDDLVSE